MWLELCAYRREDTYSNDNYISDGLDNAELFKRALEFYEVAQNEIYKSAELQHSISTSLNNLLAIDKFKPLVNSFQVGNWIRIQVDDKIFKLRLLEYEINFGSFDNIPVEFSDVTKIKNGITDVKSAIEQASSMATNYSYIQRQAKQGEESNNVINNWVENGLNTTQSKIVDSVDENLLFDKNGFWCRQYDPITQTYSDEQIKIVNSTIAITDDNWNTTKTAIGRFYYIDPKTGEQKVAYGINGETIIGKLLIGENLIISNNNNNLEFSSEGFVVESEKNKVTINPNESSIFNITKIVDDGNGNMTENAIFSLNEKGELVIVGKINLLDGSSISSGSVTGLHKVATTRDYDDLSDKPNLSDVATTGSYNDLKNKPTLSTVATSGSYNDLSNQPTKLSDFTNDSLFINKDVDNLTNYYKKTEVDNSLNSLATVATTGSYNDLTDIDELKNWVLEQIQLATN